MKRLLCFLLLTVSPLVASTGRLVNPITDVCWECIFPITISGVNVTPGYSEQSNYKKRFCVGPGIPPKAGLPISFWEAAAMVDVTRHAYKLIGMGGVTIGSDSIRNRGAVSTLPAEGMSSFYNVHYYKWPLLSWLGLLTDFTCTEKGEMDIPYISELDPLWNDDQLALILNPEAFLFSNPAAQAACIADCAAVSLGRSSDKAFWCAGCQGSLYPFSGSVAHHTGGVQTSSLLVHRLLAKMHRSALLFGYEDEGSYEPKLMPVIKKSLYKTQLVYPVAQTKGPCNVLGRSSLVWGAGKSYPHEGEDFVYLIWMKRQCCLDAVQFLAL